MNSDRDAEQRATEAHYKGGGLFELSGHVIDRVVEVLGRPETVKSWLRHDTSTPDKLADNNVAIFEYDKALAVITQSAKMSGAGDHRSFEILGHGWQLRPKPGVESAADAGQHAQAEGSV